MSELIPGLPNYVAFLCLARVSRSHHASLRAVCTTWREVVDSKELYIVRKELGVTDETVFLLRVSSFEPPGQLHCLEIDPSTSRCAKAQFVDDNLAAYFYCGGYGCASIGHLVLFFGGHGGDPSGILHIYNLLNRTWMQGAHMHCPRSVFAYGVIDGKLYVAGGLAGKDGAYVSTVTEVYDPEADSWSCVASMPFAMNVNFSCVWRKGLLVRGWTSNATRDYVFSYFPATDEWKEEEWLVDILSSFAPLDSLPTPVATKSDDSLHVGLAEHSDCYYADVVKIMKLDNVTLQWRCLCEYIDEADEYNCTCNTEGGRCLTIHGLKDKVLVMDHLGAEDVWTFKLVSSEHIVRLCLECPTEWTSTVVDA